MNRSFSKIRHIQQSNILLEQRLFEQKTQNQQLPQNKPNWTSGEPNNLFTNMTSQTRN